MSGSEEALWVLSGMVTIGLAGLIFLTVSSKRLDARLRLHEAMLAEEQRAKGLPAAE